MNQQSIGQLLSSASATAKPEKTLRSGTEGGHREVELNTTLKNPAPGGADGRPFDESTWMKYDKLWLRFGSVHRLNYDDIIELLDFCSRSFFRLNSCGYVADRSRDRLILSNIGISTNHY